MTTIVTDQNFDEEVFKSKISKYIEEKNTEFRSFS